jgi:hypothetical protein
MVKLVILKINVLTLRSHIVMKNKISRKKINIKREIRKVIKGKSSRKNFTQEKTFSHLMKMMKAF